MNNIFINAIEAMPSVNGQLELITRSSGENCVIEIKDNGIGISKENIKNIFKPYFSNKPGGLGLGLSATMKILEANHVGIEVQSTEGIGTSFILSCKKVS